LLFEAPCFSAKVAIIENFLALRLAGSMAAYDLKRIENSVNLITHAKGAVQVDSLSDAACLSRKQFERIFTGYIGTSPKQFLKTVRFQYSLQIKHLNPEMPLTELAYSGGYYDQSHMINDFRTLSGKTPGQYFAECEPYSDFFSE
jgi:AraC-like DNA-binding protein